MPAERRSLSQTVVAITGAGSGIGQAAAELLLESGASIVAADINPAALDGLVSRWGSERVATVAMDVRNPDDSSVLVDTALAAFGRLDSLVANVGIGYFGGITEWSDEQVAQMIDTNSLGTIWPIRAVVRHFDSRPGGGDIVIIASVAGLGTGNAYEAVYAATKYSQVGLAVSLDREVRERGIRVSVIAPAAVDTNFAHGTGRTPGDPVLEEFLRPSDVGFAVQTVLEQPRRMRTALWTMWSMAEKS
ncbi:SDR family oxidoreductase [Lysinibacter cavernae]|uniref:3-oxoacyl-[acyl-carrier protein] reductase n=1 Tax=Lysinibacter cavernae TaxID=1640652 RepID=A0A7X5TTC8_9MICO|nr:SDR family oxidoreductase [Lysinibacter cavernae]NIH53153.1 3-oxoacyl-[acyl-carrier protein] reductase [Lysinibacter cavernae]